VDKALHQLFQITHPTVAIVIAQPLAFVGNDLIFPQGQFIYILYIPVLSFHFVESRIIKPGVWVGFSAYTLWSMIGDRETKAWIPDTVHRG
jgi:hypothetical protein